MALTQRLRRSQRHKRRETTGFHVEKDVTQIMREMERLACVYEKKSPFFLEKIILFFLLVLQVALSVKGGGEGHVIQGSWDGVRALVRQHSGDTVFRLIRGQLAAEDVGGDERLLSGQNPEALKDLLGGVVVLRLPRHEVEESVESDTASVVGVHDREDALEVSVSLRGVLDVITDGDEAVSELFGVE